MPEDFAKIVREWEAGQLTMKDVTRLCGMSESTFYRRLKEHLLTEKK